MMKRLVLFLVLVALLATFSSAENTLQADIPVEITKYVESFGNKIPLTVVSIRGDKVNIKFGENFQLMDIWESVTFNFEGKLVALRLRSVGVSDGLRYATFDISHSINDIPPPKVPHNLDYLKETISKYITLTTGEIRELKIGPYYYQFALIKADLPYIIFSLNGADYVPGRMAAKVNEAKTMKVNKDTLWIRAIEAKRISGPGKSVIHQVKFYIDSNKYDIIETVEEDKNTGVNILSQEDVEEKVDEQINKRVEELINFNDNKKSNTENNLITKEQIGVSIIDDAGVTILNDNGVSIAKAPSGFEGITGNAVGVNIIDEKIKAIVDSKISTECNGCKVDSKCYPFGMRFKLNEQSVYCADDTDVYLQKNDDAICENNFQCKSNVCAVGFCTSKIGKNKGIFSGLLNVFDLFKR